MELKEIRDKIFYGSWIIAGVVFFALFLISYYGTPAEYSASQIPLEIPANAEKVENAETTTETYQSISYGAGKDMEFIPVKVNNPMLFKTGFDKVYFSVNYEKYSAGGENEDRVAVFMRGIKYNELPRVYEYSNSLYILPKELVGPNWYERSGFTASEKSPWTVTGNYRKNTGSEGFIISLFASAVLGLIAAVIIMVVVVELILYFGKIKILKVETEKS